MDEETVRPEDKGELPKVDNDLLRAATNGDTKEIEKLVRTGERLIEWREQDLASKDVLTSHLAMQTNEKPVMGVHCEDVSGDTPLTLASENGKLEAVMLLLELGADIDRGDRSGSTALMKAAGQGHSHVLELLLEAGAEVDAVDVFGNTALHRAAKYGKLESAKQLVAAGAVPSITNKTQKQSALDLAHYYGRRDVLAMLRAAGSSKGLKAIRAEVHAIYDARAKAAAEEEARIAAEAQAKIAAVEAKRARDAAQAEAEARAHLEATRAAEAARVEAEAKAAAEEAARWARQSVSFGDASIIAEARHRGVYELLDRVGCADAGHLSSAVAFCTERDVKDLTQLRAVGSAFVDALQLSPTAKRALLAVLRVDVPRATEPTSAMRTCPWIDQLLATAQRCLALHDSRADRPGEPQDAAVAVTRSHDADAPNTFRERLDRYAEVAPASKTPASGTYTPSAAHGHYGRFGPTHMSSDKVEPVSYLTLPPFSDASPPPADHGLSSRFGPTHMLSDKVEPISYLKRLPASEASPVVISTRGGR